MKFLKYFFVLNLLFAGALSSQAQVSTDIPMDYTHPEQYILGEINIIGIEYLNPEALKSITGLKQGDVISIPGDEISKAIKKLWDQGLVGDVRVEVDRIDGKIIYLNFILKERPQLSKFIYSGVKKGEREDIEKSIGISRGRIVTEALQKNAEKKVLEFYQEKGFLNTKVSFQLIPDTSLENSVALKITVDRRHKVRIDDITIEGNANFSDNKIEKKMKKTKERSLAHILSNKKLLFKEFDADRDKIIEFYNSQGYRDAEILSWDSTHIGEKFVNLEIKISEGRRYYFRNITWTGNTLYTDKFLADILNVKKGDVYNMEALERKLNFNPNGPDISSLYLDKGYLFFSIDAAEVMVEGDSIDIEMRIYEGGQATIKNVTVSGNTKTHDHVILREIRTLPGEKFSRADLIRTQRELMQLGYFDPEQIGINPIPNPQDETVDIHYSVVEKPSDQIQLSGGWGGSFGFVGTVGLVFNNFSLNNVPRLKTWSPLPSGDGQRLSLNVQANGRAFQTYSLSFTEPWLGGAKPTSFSVSLQSSVQNRLDYSSIPAKKIGGFNLTGVTVSLGKRLKWPDDFFTVTYSLSYMHYKLENYVPLYGQSIFSTGEANKLALTYSISRNNIDDFNFPTSGSNLSLGITLTPPHSLFNGVDYSDPNLTDVQRFKWIEYNKWMLDGDMYTTLIPGKKRKLVLRSKFHFGFLGTYKPEAGIGPFDRFKLGGSGLSGFNFLLATDIIGLRGYGDNILPVGQAGGVIFDKFAFELRYPVVSSPAFSLSLHSFFEAGNSWYNYKDFNPFNVYRSAGIGAKIFMPAFGLIGLDWGIPFDEVPGTYNPNHKPRLTFSIGQQIR